MERETDGWTEQAQKIKLKKEIQRLGQREKIYIKGELDEQRDGQRDGQTEMELERW